MIVNHKKEGWEIIYQYAHGLLAGQFANQLRHDLRPRLWVETLTAIVEHDDNQLNFDEKSYLSDIGTPLDFTEEEFTPSKTLEQAQRLVNGARHKSGWVALLISAHVNFLYHEMAEEYPEIKKFLEEQHELRKKLRRRYKINEEQAESYYQLLLFCDRCSLILCKEEIPSVGRILEINHTIEGKKYFIRMVDDESFTIEPWCFQADEFSVSVEINEIQQVKFKSSKEFEQALGNCPIKLKEWKFVKQN